MDKNELIEKLKKYKEGKITLEEVLSYLKDFPYIEMDFAKIDTHRSLRTGYPEVIFCEGKTPSQIVKIFNQLLNSSTTVMGTRVSQEMYRKIKSHIPHLKYYKEARIIVIGREKKSGGIGNIAVITGGTSDIPVAEEAAVTAEIFGSRVNRFYDVGVAGIHRLFDSLNVIRQANVIIAVAGMEGALPGVISGLVNVPVIAVPTSIGYGANLGGIAPLLTMLNSCAPGVSVVNIDNGFGAGYIADMINKMSV